MNRQQQIDSFLLEAHRLAVLRLRADPSRIDEVSATLGRWRSRAGATRSDPYWDEWEALLSGGVDAVKTAVCGVGDHAAALRNVPPVGTLLTQRERGALLRASRHGADASRRDEHTA